MNAANRLDKPTQNHNPDAKPKGLLAGLSERLARTRQSIVGQVQSLIRRKPVLDAEVREGTELYPGPFNIILTNSIDETEQTLLSEIFEFQTVDSYSCGLDNVSYHRQVLPY
jgi:hypothetical protein